jgi:hypothetical protein
VHRLLQKAVPRVRHKILKPRFLKQTVPLGVKIDLEGNNRSMAQIGFGLPNIYFRFADGSVARGSMNL